MLIIGGFTSVPGAIIGGLITGAGEKLAEAYLFDEAVRDFLSQSNPWAERAMIERLLEAAERGLWENPDAATLDRLRSQYGDNDAWLEGLTVPSPQASPRAWGMSPTSSPLSIPRPV